MMTAGRTLPTCCALAEPIRYGGRSWEHPINLQEQTVSIGLIRLLDDVVGLAKLAAASIDDVAGQAAKQVPKRRGW